jgi:hypothetical protein
MFAPQMAEIRGVESAAPVRRGRLRALFGTSRTLVQIAYRDPENVPERLALQAAERLAEPSREWAGRSLARRGGADAAVVAEELRRHTAAAARIDGAVAGTPFFIALIPGYLSYLWQEAQMVLRTAALFGHVPTTEKAAAEMLALRGIHPSVEAAQAAVVRVATAPLPPRPSERRALRVWVQSIRMILVFGGFLGRPDPAARARPHYRLRLVAGLLAGAAAWVVTSLLPLTFMVVMAWSCEHDARELGRRAQAYYGGEATSAEAAIALAGRREDRGHSTRQILRSVALFCSIAVPIAFVAFAEHVRNTTGVSWVAALGALVALSLVIATAVVARSR